MIVVGCDAPARGTVAEAEVLAEAETETEAESVAEAETGAETETETGAETGAEAETGVEAETEAVAETGAETETEAVAVAESTFVDERDVAVGAVIDAAVATDAAARSAVVGAAAPTSVARSAREERALRERLASSPIVLVERGRGGRSLAFRVTLEDGTRAYFKPEQTFSGTHWYAEIAAHHLDRALGLDRTPVVVGRRVPWSELAAAAEGDQRVPEIVVGEDGTVRGAMIAWIEARLVPLRAPIGWERWIAIEEPAAITPFQSARAWRRARGAAVDPDELEARDEPVPDAASSAPDPATASPATASAASGAHFPEPDSPSRAAELSDLVAFDFLVHNVDRWSASSTNVRTLGEHGPLVFLDQAAGFSPRRARLTLLDERLAAAQRFRRRTVEAVRTLDLDAFATALARDPLAPILDARQLEHVAQRRQALLDYIDALVAAHGEDAVYAW